jgi:hypothetical protein
MRHFYLKAVIEKTAGELADWAAVDRAMMQAASLARDLAAWKHPKLSAVRIAGELNQGPADGATLDELLERIKGELVKLGPLEGRAVQRRDGCVTTTLKAWGPG